MRAAATLSRSVALCLVRSMPLGKYCRRRPLLFSFVPRCHGLLPRAVRVAEVNLQTSVDAQLRVLCNLGTLVPGQGLA